LRPSSGRKFDEGKKRQPASVREAQAAVLRLQGRRTGAPVGEAQTEVRKKRPTERGTETPTLGRDTQSESTFLQARVNEAEHGALMSKMELHVSGEVERVKEYVDGRIQTWKTAQWVVAGVAVTALLGMLGVVCWMVQWQREAVNRIVDHEVSPRLDRLERMVLPERGDATGHEQKRRPSDM
jgi:hypothetical protein